MGVLALAVGMAGVFVYTGVTQEREYRRLVATGDEALAADQTVLAIEAFSGAITLKSDSMLAYLKRGETYRRRDDLVSALRDLRTATRLDPVATRPLEQLGDVNYALRDYARAAERYDAYVQPDDRSSTVFYKLALARYRMGLVAAAIPPLRQALGVDDQFAEAYYLLGLCLREQQQLGGGARGAARRGRPGTQADPGPRSAGRPARVARPDQRRNRTARGARRVRRESARPEHRARPRASCVARPCRLMLTATSVLLTVLPLTLGALPRPVGQSLSA